MSSVRHIPLWYRQREEYVLTVYRAIDFFFFTSFIACRKFGLPYLGKATAAARAALPIPNSASGIFLCPKEGMAANAWDL